jgi:hypothetical protein
MMSKLLFIALALVGLAASLSAQPPADTYKVNYYANANTAGAPDGTVEITNVGTENCTACDPSGNLCALIYVFSPDQELKECCGCSLSPDGLRTLSINTDLTSNSINGVVPTTGVIKIISSIPTSTGCNPAKPSPAAGIRAWSTHIQTGPVVTETEFLDSTLSTTELNRLTKECSAIGLVGSGQGICSCGTGD